MNVGRLPNFSETAVWGQENAVTQRAAVARRQGHRLVPARPDTEQVPSTRSSFPCLPNTRCCAAECQENTGSTRQGLYATGAQNTRDGQNKHRKIPKHNSTGKNTQKAREGRGDEVQGVKGQCSGGSRILEARKDLHQEREHLLLKSKQGKSHWGQILHHTHTQTHTRCEVHVENYTQGFGDLWV